MPIPWLVVLQSVPWTEVVKNAPKVAEGARKLWGAASRKTPAEAAPSRQSSGNASADPVTNIVLAGRVADLNAAVDDLHAQMLASSELIKALADQNAELVQRIDTLHRRTRWLTVAVTVAVVGTATMWYLMQ